MCGNEFQTKEDKISSNKTTNFYHVTEELVSDSFSLPPLCNACGN